MSDSWGTWEMRVPAILSCVGCSLIILTFIMFPDLRRLRYIELVFFVAVNVLIASIGAISDFWYFYFHLLIFLTLTAGGALGNVPNGSFACYFQGFTMTANVVSATFWTVVIAFQLWYVITKGQTIKDLRPFHLVCSGLPLILALLPLSTNAYGKHHSSSE